MLTPAAQLPMEAGNAASALSAIGDSRSWLAYRVIAPGWYHLAFGLLAGGVIAEGEIRSWILFAWSVAAYTAGCSALSWWNQRRVGVAMNYFDACTRAVFAGHVLTLSRANRDRLLARPRSRGTWRVPGSRRARRAPHRRVRALD